MSSDARSPEYAQEIYNLLLKTGSRKKPQQKPKLIWRRIRLDHIDLGVEEGEHSIQILQNIGGSFQLHEDVYFPIDGCTIALVTINASNEGCLIHEDKDGVILWFPGT